MTRRFLIGWTALVSGAAVMSFEILGIRLVAPYFGSDIYTWGNLLGVIMFSLTVGYWIGGAAADRYTRLSMAGIPALFAGLLIGTSPWIVRLVCDGALSLHFPLRVRAILADLVLFFPASALLGALQPALVRLSMNSMDRCGSVSGRLSAFSAMGSLIGTFVTTFLLLNVGGPGTARSLCLIGSLLILSGMILILADFARKRVALAMTALAVLAVSVAGFFLKPSQTLVLPQVGSGRSIVAEVSSPYHDIRVIDGIWRNDQPQNLLRQMSFGDEWTFLSGYFPKDPSTFVAANLLYDKFLMAWMLNPRIQKIAVIGVAGGMAVREILDFFMPLKGYPTVHVDAVDLDPALFQVARDYFDYPVADPRLTNIAMDGRNYLRETSGKLDYILVDVFEAADRVPEHFFTREFFSEVGSSRVDLQACKLEYSIVSPK